MPDVAVVGSGPNGLAAAVVMTGAGVEGQVYEASANEHLRPRFQRIWGLKCPFGLIGLRLGFALGRPLPTILDARDACDHAQDAGLPALRRRARLREKPS